MVEGLRGPCQSDGWPKRCAQNPRCWYGPARHEMNPLQQPYTGVQWEPREEEHAADWCADTASGTLSGWGSRVMPAALVSSPPVRPAAQGSLATMSQAVPEAVEAPRSTQHRAQDLFADINGEADSQGQFGNLAGQVDAAGNGEESSDGSDGGEPADSGAESIDVAELQALLRDNAALFEECEAALVAAVGGAGQQRSQHQDQQQHGQQQQRQQQQQQQHELQQQQPLQRPLPLQQSLQQPLQQQPLLPQLRSAEELQEALNHICRRCHIDLVDDDEAVDLFDGAMDLGVFYQFAREYFGTLCRTLTMTV